MSRGGANPRNGINPPARRLQSAYDGAFDWLGKLPAQPCAYAEHRHTDWRLSAEHPWVCGICRPPAALSLVGEWAEGGADVHPT